MRHLFIATVLTVCIGCLSTKNKTTAFLLNGTWIPVREEMNGKDLPPASFSTQRLVINDTSYIFTAESVDKGSLSYRDGKMDIYGKEGVNKGKHFKAIYKLENEQLTIVYNLGGDNFPSGFETTSKPSLFLATFRKE
jgi:uncharacterized protein (TIGR03067 family)